jgi:hypothetical protein
MNQDNPKNKLFYFYCEIIYLYKNNLQMRPNE